MSLNKNIFIHPKRDLSFDFLVIFEDIKVAEIQNSDYRRSELLANWILKDLRRVNKGAGPTSFR